MPSEKSDLLQGTLDVLILKTLSNGSMHGWGISQRIQQVSEEVLAINQGSLYPALHRLEERGWISAEWGSSGIGSCRRRSSLSFTSWSLARSRLLAVCRFTMKPPLECFRPQMWVKPRNVNVSGLRYCRISWMEVKGRAAYPGEISSTPILPTRQRSTPP